MNSCTPTHLLSLFEKIQEIAALLKIGIHIREAQDDSNIVSTIHYCADTILEELRRKNVEDSIIVQGAENMYELIQKELQKQQNLNRNLIKKELEFKQYQKCLVDELGEEKKVNKKLQGQLSKITDQMHTKEMEIQLLNNEKKMMAKDKKGKDFVTMQTLLNDKRLDGIRYASKELNSARIQQHRRRKSDQLNGKRPSTAQPKKKGSVTKR